MSDRTATPDDEPDQWERHLSAPVRGRKVIVAFDLLASMTRVVDQLRRWGAQRPMLMPQGTGTGALPDGAAAVVHHLVETDYASMTDQVRGRLHPDALLDPPARAAVDEYDPGREARWWLSPVGPNSPLMGRRALGGRPPHQIALEDKMIVDVLLGSVDAERSPAVLAPATYEDLMRATASVLDASGGDQVVWAGDASRGINGGGDFVRWVRAEEHARESAEFFRAECAKVRVSAFLEGVPCSIHGLVLADGVVVFRPVELVTLRDPSNGRFVYAGMGTTWDPPEADTRQMRQLARAVGAHLQEEHGYRGAFGIDGVLTRDGFRVTELNARLSGGLTRLGRAAPATQLELVQMNALIGRDIGMPAADYEELVMALVDEVRFVDVMGISSRLIASHTIDVPVAVGEQRLDIAGLDDEVVGTVSRGPSPMGSFIRMTMSPGVVGLGDRAAPLSVLLYELADREWDAGFGRLLMAPDVRRAAE